MCARKEINFSFPFELNEQSKITKVSEQIIKAWTATNKSQKLKSELFSPEDAVSILSDIMHGPEAFSVVQVCRMQDLFL